MAAVAEKRTNDTHSNPSSASRPASSCQDSPSQGSPCQGTANFVLDLLSKILQEQARAQHGKLEINDVVSVIDSFKSAPGQLAGFYGSTYDRCHGPADEADTSTSFEQAVLRLLEPAGGRLVVGKVQAVGLEAIRTQVGDLWPRLSDAVYRLATTVIRRNLAPGDCFTRAPGGGFLICFADLDESRGWFKAQAIAREISNHILGEGGTDSGIDEGLSEAQIDELSKISALCQSTNIGSAQAGGGEIIELVVEKLERSSDKARNDARKTLREIGRSATIVPRPVVTDNLVPSHLQIADFDAPRQARRERLLASDGLSVSLTAELDLISLSLATDYISHREPDQNSLLVADLHRATLGDPAWSGRYLEVCEKLSPRVRDALVLNLKGYDLASKSPDVDRDLTRIAAYSRLSMLTLDGSLPPKLQLPESELHILSIDYRTIASQLRSARIEAAALIRRIRARKIRVMVDNLLPKTSVEVFQRLGVSFFAFRTDGTD